ncbi:MAG: hypothetical protein AYK22_07415 [Thermoplasmatales archaeon SG8-52-3]|nr:MAG: hypothetical protein AYK22_07415 [Thermoplasmatales archaeon SG8-52-3]
MEIEIDSKRNNPLLNRTEIYFTIKHEGEGTPNRELIRSELADKLNVKKENIIVNTIDSSFGKHEITGYAKIYSSIAKAKETEHDHFLKRNKLIEDEKKQGKKVKEAPAAEAKPVVDTSKPPKEEATAPRKDETPIEPEPTEEVKPEEPAKEEEPAEPPKAEEPEPPVEEPISEEPSKEQPPEKEMPSEEPVEKKEETAEEDVKEEEKQKEKPKEEETGEKNQAEEKKE